MVNGISYSMYSTDRLQDGEEIKLLMLFKRTPYLNPNYKEAFPSLKFNFSMAGKPNVC